MTELLVEILTEEIPARFQEQAEKYFSYLVTKELKEHGLSYDKITPYSTPRRLAVIVTGLPTIQPDKVEDRKGPSIDAPEQALNGFLKSVGLQKDDLEIRDTPKGQAYFAVIHHKAQPTIDILPNIINTAIKNIPWGKSMRFADETFRFARPLQRIVAVFGTDIVQGALDLGNGKSLSYTNKTLGHRFMGNGEDISVCPKTYESKLKDSYVIVDWEKRRGHISEKLQKIAKDLNCDFFSDYNFFNYKLLKEVVGLVEYPVVLVGKIPEKYMTLPKDVLITSLREHQKFFVFKQDGDTLAPYFATVANIDATDGGDAVIKGNEKVLNARLADSMFFYNNDVKNWNTYTQNKGLEKIVFHEKLGTVADKINRIETIAKTVAQNLEYEEDLITMVKECAKMCKSDLVSDMVFEFPELQGTMGKYYALNAGVYQYIAQGIEDHYKPRGASDGVPEEDISTPVAIADKMDTLCGFWAVGIKPTGSKDPYALRRCALGILRIVLENNLKLNIMDIAHTALQSYTETLAFDRDTVLADLEIFLRERLKHTLISKDIFSASFREAIIRKQTPILGELREEVDKDTIEENTPRHKFPELYGYHTQGIRHDYVASVIKTLDDTRTFYKVTLALAMQEHTDSVSTAKAGYDRANGIVQNAIQDGWNPQNQNIDTTTLNQNRFAKALYDSIQNIENAQTNVRHKIIIDTLTLINDSLNDFFDNVMVNTDDTTLRNTYLTLLHMVTERFKDIADFDIIEK